MCLYVVLNFLIRTQIKMYNLMDINFTFEENAYVTFVQLDEQSSKNHKL